MSCVEETLLDSSPALTCGMQVVEGRLFSEGLHTLGQAPDAGQIRSYLAAYFGDRLPEAALDEVASSPCGDDREDIEAMRQRLERSLQQVR